MLPFVMSRLFCSSSSGIPFLSCSRHSRILATTYYLKTSIKWLEMRQLVKPWNWNWMEEEHFYLFIYLFILCFEHVSEKLHQHSFVSNMTKKKSGFFLLPFLPLPCCNHLLGRKGHFREQLSAALEIIALLKSAVTAVHLIKKNKGGKKKGEAYFGKNVEKIRNPQTPD